MGSKTFEGVWFISYSHDHAPPHVHGRYGEAAVIVELLPDGTIRKALRSSAIVPRSAKRNTVKHILDVASDYALELMELWENAHGISSK